MTTTKIGLAAIAAISTAEEGRAVALALFNKMPRWVEITDDPATWPPANVVVLTQNGENVIGMHFHGDNDEPLWWQPENLFVDAPPDSMDGPIAWEDYSLSDSQNITHWRPI